MKFEWFNPNVGIPYVSIANYGITISKKTLAIMGYPQYVQLGINKSDKIIAIAPKQEQYESSIRIKQNRNAYARINNKDFVRLIENTFDKKYGKEAIRYIADWTENMLIVKIT